MPDVLDHVRNGLLWCRKPKTQRIDGQFKELNEDCMYHILERLNFSDLLSMAQVNEKYGYLASAVFKQKYSDMQFVIENYLYKEPIEHVRRNGIIQETSKKLTSLQKKFASIKKKSVLKNLLGYPSMYFDTDDEDEWEDGNNKNKPMFFEHADRIEILDHEMSLMTLKHFGSLIRKIKLAITNPEITQSKKIIENVNRFCSDSLAEIEFDVGKGRALHHITIPFKNVKQVLFNRFIPQMGHNSLSMNETFPALQTILFKVSNKDAGYINDYFSHLDHVFLESNQFDGIDGFFSANSHIRSIHLTESFPNFLEKLNAFLPNLETLTCEKLNVQGPIRFENVRKFEHQDSHSSPRNLLFPKLQELQVNFRTERLVDWVDFLKIHNKLNKLSLKSFNMKQQDFQQLTANLSDLVDVSISSWSSTGIDIDTIVEFLENQTKLERLHLDLLLDADKDLLQKRIDDEWTITRTTFGLLFERKNKSHLEY